MSTESVTLDRFVGDCYIIGAKLMMRALRGKPWGALFFLAFVTLLCSCFSLWPGSGPRTSLIPPLVEELAKHCLGVLFDPLAEFWVVLPRDLDGD